MSTTWFITGTSSGFGRLLTERLLARRDHVAATLRQPGALDDLRAKNGDRLWLARLDVTDTGQVGIEGFCETVAREIVPFGIGLTIVEPGADAGPDSERPGTRPGS
jgi:NAD(P)-dependent dehydrogenase (short-subunit alcohol dehydrogenase family)